MTKPDLVVFDMIGTTVVPSSHIPEAFADALREVDIELSEADISAVRGKSKRAAISELLHKNGGAEFAKRKSTSVYAMFKQSLLDCYRNEAVVAIDGAADTFAWCRANDVYVALTTGFDLELASLLLDKLGWKELVDTLVCNDDVDSGRPAPDLILEAMRRLDCIDAARVASVGDTVSDLGAGANACTGWNIGVLSGAHTKDQLRAAAHTNLINSVADLPGLFS